MAKAQFNGGIEVSRHVADAAYRLHRRLPELAAAIRRSLEDQIPELRADEQITELLEASVEGNVDTVLHALRNDIAVERVEAPTTAMEYTRRLAQHGVPVNALVRAYRLGQRQMNELVFSEVRALDISEHMRFAVIEAITATLFDYIDWISQQMVAAYEDERVRWLENQNSLRALRVREILAATKAVDVDAASISIRYPLRWHHLGLVMWYRGGSLEGDELAALQRFLGELGEAANAAAEPLFVAADQTCGWGWLPYRAAAPDAEAKVRQFALTRTDSPSVAIGPLSPGLEGFRQSHRESQSARRVAMVAKREPAIVAATDPGLSIAALLSGDITDTRAWVGKVLGGLATDDENDARLRDTLRIYLGCGCSYKMAAEELNLHFNTVKYRVGRAVARRGREIGADRLDVELALLICHWYGTAVLQAK